MAHGINRTWIAIPVAALAVLLATAAANGVACPAGGAKVEVCVYNPTNTTSPLITVSGQNTILITCTGPAPIGGNYSSSFTVGAFQTYCTPGGVPAAGLVSGMFVHRIQVAGTTQDQYQKGMVVASNGALTRIDWTYFPSVLTVNQAGAGGSGTCPVNAVSNPAACDIRSAATAAKNVAGTAPVLIQLRTSPGTIPGPVLQLQRVNLTIDGTGANGNPYIVGDPNAAAAGSQDPIPMVLDLLPGNAVWIQADDITLKGLEVRQTLGGGAISGNNLITQFAPYVGTRLEAVRLDAGNSVDCLNSTDPECDNPFSLVRLAPRASLPFAQSLTVKNVEGRSAIYQGIDAQANNDVVVERSWIRNNYSGNVRGDRSRLRLEANVIERAGLRASDDRAVRNLAHGVTAISATGTALNLSTSGNIIRNNRSAGMHASGLGDVLVQRDVWCGNGGNGLVSAAAGGFVPSVNSLGGVGATYNAGNGVRVAQDSFTAVSLDNDSVFASNAQCGLFNTWPVDPVLARNNQWRGGPPPTPIPDTCAGQFGAGPVDIGTGQSPDTSPVTISAVTPSNAILIGQTLRVTGTGFNGIAGNPLAGPAPVNCSTGITTNGTGQGGSCCRVATRANSCAAVNTPTDGNGNCVQLKNSAGVWSDLGVQAVSPAFLEVQVPTTVFSCLGKSGEQVYVGKRRGMTLREDLEFYCTTATL